MNHIEKLIQEHCPDGVEYLSVSELFELRNGYTPSKSNPDFWENGTVPWFRMEDIRTNGRVLNKAIQSVSESAVKKSGLYAANSIIMATLATIGEHALVTVPFLVNQQLTVMTIKPEFQEKMSSKFAYYYCFVLAEWTKRNTNKGSVSTVEMTGFKRFRFPVPPLPVQEAIVEILDTFSALEAELEAELEARKKQYQYYREELTRFDFTEGVTSLPAPLRKLVSEHCPDGVEHLSVSELFELRNGYTPSKSNPDFWENGTVPWFRMEDIRTNGRALSDSLQKIHESAVKGGRHFPANSLIFATSATIGEHALVTTPFMANQRFTAAWVKPEYVGQVDIKFMFYYGFIIDEWCLRNVTKSSFASVDMKGFKKLRIPVPPLPVQEAIVEILDQFDALVNDLTRGLPAEIAARRKQYEYYRGKLLTFKELGVAE